MKENILKNITKGVEDYLEAILIIKLKNKKVKATNIADFFNVSRPAITKELKLLESNDYIEKQGMLIELTQKGLEIANKVYEKHLICKEFLIKIGVPEEIAEIDCCKIEHCIDEITFEKIKEFCNR